MYPNAFEVTLKGAHLMHLGVGQHNVNAWEIGDFF